MARSKINDLDSMPVVLNAQDLQKILGLSKGAVYEIFKRQDFPSIRVGRRLLVSKQAFIRWLDR